MSIPLPWSLISSADRSRLTSPRYEHLPLPLGLMASTRQVAELWTSSQRALPAALGCTL